MVLVSVFGVLFGCIEKEEWSHSTVYGHCPMWVELRNVGSLGLRQASGASY